MSTHKEIMDDFYGEIITRSKIVGQPFKMLADEDIPERPVDVPRRLGALLVKAVSLYTALEKRGNKYVGLCPFHKETSPSFTVDKGKGLYHCFGCGAGGDLVSFIQEIDGLGLEEVVKLLGREGA